MSTIDTTATAGIAGHAAQTPVAASASKRVHGFWTMLLAEWRAYRRFLNDRHELRAMNDRMLADIGISRSEIAHAVRYGRDRA